MKTTDITPQMDIEVASGLIDAASCITVIKQPRPTVRGYAYRLSLLVRRNENTELRDLVRAFGIEGSISEISSRGAPSYALAWYGASAVAVLEVAKPWLRIRAAEARLAAQFWKAGGFDTYARGQADDALWDVRDELYLRMRELKASLTGRGRTINKHRKLATVATTAAVAKRQRRSAKVSPGLGESSPNGR